MMATVTPINPDPQTSLDFALAYARLGWHAFPCHYIDASTKQCSCANPNCKSPGKHPFSQLVPRGQDHATTDESTIRNWWARQPKANVAIFLAPSGLMAVDIDPRNGGYDTIDALEAQHGPIASDVTQFTGGGGEHRVFSLPHNAGSLPGRLGPGVDVKINGYIMVEPSNHASGHGYGWEASSNPLDGVVPSPLPDWLRGQFASGAASKYTLPESPIKPLSDSDKADLAAALQHIASDDRDTWVQIGMALHSTQAGSEAFQLWDAWSQSSTKYDPVDQTRVWHSFRNRGLSGVTKASIFKLAMNNEWKNSRAKEVEQERRLVQVAGPKPKFEFSRVDSLEITEIDWMVDGYIEADSLDLIFGEPGCGKSFISIDIGCCVATGTPWHGHAVKQGMVIYIAGEGHNGLARRFKGWEKLHGVSLANAPIYKSHRAAQLYDKSSAIDVAEAVKAIAEKENAIPRLIIIDTVARNMGGDENSTQDMNLFIEHLDGLLRHPYKAAVLCVHHSGKASPGQARGSTALRGALDAEYQVEMDQSSKMIVLSNKKMKDGEVPQEKRFSIRQVGLGVMDSEGEEIKGAALETVDISGLVEQAKDMAVTLTKNQRTAIKALEGLFYRKRKDGDDVPITFDDWREAAIGNGVARNRFYEAKDALVAKGKVIVTNGGIVELTYDLHTEAE